MNERILIKGAGDHASAVAHRLFRSGFRVVMTELGQPLAVRRTVSFCSAVYESEITVEGVRAVGWSLGDVGGLARFHWSHIPVFVDPGGRMVGLWEPQVIVDGRVAKRNLDNSVDDAPLVIGLGPGLEAGRDVHYAIETHRGHDLGRIVSSGFTSANTGIPGNIGGYTVERVLRSPSLGIFGSGRQIGDFVEKGELVGRIQLSREGAGVRTPRDPEVRVAVAGILRGLLFPGVPVVKGQKLGDIDPRGAREYCFTMSDKVRAISGSVLELVARHFHQETPRRQDRKKQPGKPEVVQ